MDTIVVTTAITAAVTLVKLFIDLYRERRNREWMKEDREKQQESAEMLKDAIHGRANQLSSMIERNTELTASTSEFQSRLSTMIGMFQVPLDDIRRKTSDTNAAVRDDLKPDVKAIVDKVIGGKSDAR